MSERRPLSITGFIAIMLRVGATGFGGPMALISMLQEHLVERRKAISSDEFSEGVAIGQILPGPIAVDAAIHVGYRLYGWLGAIAGGAAIIAPPFLMMLIVTPLYFHYGRVPEAQGFFAGVRPAVAAAIVAATLRLGKKGIRDWRGYVIAAVVFLWMLFRHLLEPLIGQFPADAIAHYAFRWTGAVFLVVLSGVLGMLFYREPPSPKTGGQGKTNGGG